MRKFENSDPAKRAVGYAAVDKHVVDGTCIGLGTGTTAYWAIERVGQRIAAGERICRNVGIAFADFFARGPSVFAPNGLPVPARQRRARANAWKDGGRFVRIALWRATAGDLR